MPNEDFKLFKRALTVGFALLITSSAAKVTSSIVFGVEGGGNLIASVTGASGTNPFTTYS